ncbi:MAG: glycine betaine/proline transport system permease protein [Candidatus Poriferisodalaceae bacterium]|jgi:glycine betaine/proline transport system permease protein
MGDQLLATAEEDSVIIDRSGHFLDRAVNWVFDLEKGDSVFSWLGDASEWIIWRGIIAVPVLFLIGAFISRRASAIVGGVLGVIGLFWYRFYYTTDSHLDSVFEAGKVPVADNAILDQWNIPFGSWFEQVTRWVDINMGATLAVFKWPFESLLDLVVGQWLVEMSWLTVCLGMFFLGWALRNIRVGITSFMGLALCGLLGFEYWETTAFTLGFIAVIVFLCVVIGIPLGILCGRVDGVWKVVRPILDAMQVVHSFVYMLPFIFFFGIGDTSATMVSMVFALPPLVRLTNLGIRQVPEDVIEAARAYGAPEWRVLFDVQLPLARPAIMTGLNQNLLLAISMLGIAAIMGANGLGRLLFRAISNLDIALAASAGLAFFLVAVVLDRLTQPEGGDGTNLAGRVAKAWQNRKTPERLLDESESVAAAARAAKQIEKPKPVERFMPAVGTERTAIMVSLAGVVITLVSLLMTWTKDAGLISAFGRRADEDLAGQTFNGLAASGGSWFGILIAMAAVLVVVSVIITITSPGKQSRWFGADGSAVAAIASAVTALMFLFANAPDAAAGHSTGGGLYVALIGTLVMAAGTIWWTWLTPVGASRPIQATIGWGRVIATGFAILTLVVSAYSGWTYDTRADSVITPELQAELDDIQALAREAEAAGNLAEAGTLAAEMTTIIAGAQRTGDIVLDGFTSKGAGLGAWLILVGFLGLIATLPAVGVFGFDELFRYRWSSIASGLGLGVVFVGIGWVISIARVADGRLLSGVGSFFAVCGGFFLFSHGLSTQTQFTRRKIYGDAASEGTPAADADQASEDAATVSV